MPAGSYRLPVSLSEEEIRFLEEIGLRAKRTGGFRLSKAAVVRALIEAAMKMDIDVAGVRSEEELRARVERAAQVASAERRKRWSEVKRENASKEETGI